jgi:hypothetical protein
MVSLGLACSARADEIHRVDAIYFGNSYTGNTMPGLQPLLARSAGRTWTVQSGTDLSEYDRQGSVWTGPSLAQIMDIPKRENASAAVSIDIGKTARASFSPSFKRPG